MVSKNNSNISKVPLFIKVSIDDVKDAYISIAITEYIISAKYFDAPLYVDLAYLRFLSKFFSLATVFNNFALSIFLFI